MRKVIATAEQSIGNLTIQVRRECTEKLGKKMVHYAGGNPTTEVTHSDSHNVVAIAEVGPKGQLKDLIRMRTGTECSGQQLKDYLHFFAKALARDLRRVGPLEKIDFKGVQVIDNYPGSGANGALWLFAQTLARHKKFEQGSN